MRRRLKKHEAQALGIHWKGQMPIHRKHYDKDWNELMKVIAKCTRVGYGNINGCIDFQWEALLGNNESMFLGNHIDEAYKCTVKFIKFYNEEKCRKLIT